MGDYDDFVKKYGKSGTSATPAPTSAAPAGGNDYAAFMAKYGKHGAGSGSAGSGGNPLAGVGRALSDAPGQLLEATGHAGSSTLDLLGRPGVATQAAGARHLTPAEEHSLLERGRVGLQTWGNAFMHGVPAAQQSANRDEMKRRLGVKSAIDTLTSDQRGATTAPVTPGGNPLAGIGQALSQAPEHLLDATRHALGGTADAAVDALLDPITILGGSGLIEQGMNRLGRAGYVGLAKGMARANPVSRAAAGVHDFVSPGGAEMGQLKRTLAATHGTAGLDKYAIIRAAAKRAPEDKAAAVTHDLFGEGLIPEKPHVPAPPPPPPPSTIHPAAIKNAVATAKKATAAKVKAAAPLGVGPGFFSNPSRAEVVQGLEGQRAGQARVASTLGVGPGFFPKEPVHVPPPPPPPVGELPTEIASALKPNPRVAPTSRVAQIARGAADLSKRATRGTTSLMFATPQLPGMPGHGSNILQTALLSHPGAAVAGTARYLASGEPIPGEALRGAYQRLPGVRGLVSDQNAAGARAAAAGARSENPQKIIPGFIDKIPGVKQLADYSARTLWGYDQAMGGALNDAWTKHYLAQGLTPKVAAARAAERVGQDIVDYGDRSDLNRVASHVLPFSTYAIKKPGIIARAALRHPERVLALTRNNPNYEADRNEPMSDPDAGRPLASIYNALNNKSPAAKGGAPYPGAQYQRASQGALANDLLGVANPYFTYGPPAKHAEGNAALGWLKLLLSQTVGNVAGGDALLNKTGLNYFGER